MKSLASCYFCGTALDDPVARYRVVDADRSATAVALCRPCRQKLVPILEAALDEADTGTVALGSLGVADEDADTLLTVEGESPDVADPAATDESESARPAEPGPEEELAELTAEDDQGRADDETDEVSVAMEPDAPDAPQSDLGGEPGEDAETVADDDDTADPADAEQSAAEAGQSADSEPATETDEPAAQTTISALEYNKVMRLLQNREFPVDRTEIETVAANAYSLARSECAEVIDLAIDRGLIAEEEGQLTRPD